MATAVADTAERNLISGNAGQGCFILGGPSDDTSHNVVAGNFIGTDVSGTSALGNGGAGVNIVRRPVESHWHRWRRRRRRCGTEPHLGKCNKRRAYLGQAKQPTTSWPGTFLEPT